MLSISGIPCEHPVLWPLPQEDELPWVGEWVGGGRNICSSSKFMYFSEPQCFMKELRARKSESCGNYIWALHPGNWFPLVPERSSKASRL